MTKVSICFYRSEWECSVLPLAFSCLLYTLLTVCCPLLGSPPFIHVLISKISTFRRHILVTWLGFPVMGILK